MDITVGLITIGVIYIVLLFFDNFFKTCAHYPYIRFLEGTGFQIKFLSVSWKTKAFNRTIIRWGNNRPHFLNLWFNLGLYTSLILLPIAMLLLLYSVFHNFAGTNNSETTLLVEPIIPGVNLPLSELGYYSLTLICCSIVHELGHALAAVSENVNLIEVGFNIWFILPVAYINISTEKFSALGCKKTLKILCAGIWHNLVLALAAFVFYQSLPFLFSIMFQVDSGVTITQVAKNSPLSGSRGLNIGDTITEINGCIVSNENTWYDCLVEVETNKLALCLEADLIHNFDESVPLKHLENGNLDCCDGKKQENICFEYLDSVDGILELPGYACLPGRRIIEQSEVFCTLSPHVCPNSLFCFRPILSNTSNLFKIICKSKIIIYIGLASDIYKTTEVSSYIPQLYFTTTQLPDVITKFVKYIILFSLGLALINIIPCVYMDGQYILEILGNKLLKKKCTKNLIRLILVVIIWSFTGFLFFLCLQAIVINLF